jgi:hypothetical protein
MNLQAERPPLYVTLVDEGQCQRHALVDPSNAADVPPGRWFCDVRAPNGAQKQVWIDIHAGEGFYDELLARLSEFGEPSDLWIDPGAFEEPALDSYGDMGLFVWAHGRMLDSNEWRLRPVRQSRSATEIAVDAAAEVDHLQFWTATGPSLMVCWPKRATLVLAAGRRDRPRSLRPLAVGRPSTTSAYWGFVRHNVSDGAFRLGQSIATRCFGEHGSCEADEAIVAAHWLTVFGVDGDERHAVRRHLAEHEAMTDALVMGWILDFDDGASKDLGAFARTFDTVLQRVRTHQPIYSETLRLLVERLSDAESRVVGAGDSITDHADWVRQLAKAAYWDAEHTTYRALEPSNPDPKASGADLAPELKKKGEGRGATEALRPRRVRRRHPSARQT